MSKVFHDEGKENHHKSLMEIEVGESRSVFSYTMVDTCKHYINLLFHLVIDLGEYLLKIVRVVKTVAQSYIERQLTESDWSVRYSHHRPSHDPVIQTKFTCVAVSAGKPTRYGNQGD